VNGDVIHLDDVGPDDVATWAALNTRGFLNSRRPSAWRLDLMRRQLSVYRFRLARIGGVACGAYCSWDLDLPVPGATTARTRAIGSLSVLTSHRRRGVARAFIQDALTGAREAGAALSLLIPSESGIYGRYGFGPATQTVRLNVDTRRIPREPSAIQFEATEDAALRDVAPALYASVAPHMPGALPRPSAWWDRACGIDVEPGQEDLLRPAVIARDESGVVVGTASYRIDGDWALGSQAGIQLLDLTASNPTAYRALWGYLADIDLTDRIQAEDRPVHEPLPWMLSDRRAVTESHRSDFQWVRVLDVPAALTARTAAGPGRVVIEVNDPAGYAAGRWLLDADEEGRISVSPSSREADVTLPVSSLGAIYLGQSPLLRLPADEHRPGARRTLQRLMQWEPEATVGLTWF
jgi:predicted acetyltransferase